MSRLSLGCQKCEVAKTSKNGDCSFGTHGFSKTHWSIVARRQCGHCKVRLLVGVGAVHREKGLVERLRTCDRISAQQRETERLRTCDQTNSSGELIRHELDRLFLEKISRCLRRVVSALSPPIASSALKLMPSESASFSLSTEREW